MPSGGARHRMTENESGPPGLNRQAASRPAKNPNSDGLPHQKPQRQIPQRSRRAVLAARQALYDGRDVLGSVEQRLLGWAAFDRQQRPLGVYETRSEAIGAVSRSLRGGGR